jgi:hypothetical protein
MSLSSVMISKSTPLGGDPLAIGSDSGIILDYETSAPIRFARRVRPRACRQDRDSASRTRLIVGRRRRSHRPEPRHHLAHRARRDEPDRQRPGAPLRRLWPDHVAADGGCRGRQPSPAARRAGCALARSRERVSAHLDRPAQCGLRHRTGAGRTAFRDRNPLRWPPGPGPRTVLLSDRGRAQRRRRRRELSPVARRLPAPSGRRRNPDRQSRR